MKINAGHDIALVAGRDLEVRANADTMSSKSNSQGVSVGIGASGFSVGYDFAKAKANGTTYTNAQIQAGNQFYARSGRDTTVSGANIQAKDVVMDVGRNFVLESLQNQYHSKNSSGSISVSTGGAVAGGYSQGKTNRSVVDDQTSIIGSESVNVNVAGNSTIRGALIANAIRDINGQLIDKGNLRLNTGTLIWEDINNSDKSKQIGFNFQVSGQNGTDIAGRPTGPGILGNNATPRYDSSNTQGITKATIGNGVIITGSDLNGLNRDINNTQIITKDKENHFSVVVAIPDGMANAISKAGSATAYAVRDDAIPIANHLLGDIIPLPSNNGGMLTQLGAFFVGDQKYIKAEILGISDERRQQINSGKEPLSFKEDNGKIYLVVGSNERYELAMDTMTHQAVVNNPSLLQNTQTVTLNGIMNTELQALLNGFKQTSAGNYTVSYDPTHGFLPDVLEVGWNKFFGQVAPTGVIRQNNEFLTLVTQENPGGIFFAPHSAGGVRMYLGLLNGSPNQFFGSQVQFSGTPVSTLDLRIAAKYAGISSMTHQINPGDFVGNVLGGNAGTTSEWARSISSFPLLFFTQYSPHSSYYCISCIASANNK